MFSLQISLSILLLLFNLLLYNNLNWESNLLKKSNLLLIIAYVVSYILLHKKIFPKEIIDVQFSKDRSYVETLKLFKSIVTVLFKF